MKTMLSILIGWVMSFVSAIMGVKKYDIKVTITIEPSEAWHLSWFISGKEIEASRRRDRVCRANSKSAQDIRAEEDRDLARRIAEAEAYLKQLKDLEREQRRREFKEWSDNCRVVLRTA